MKLPIHAFRALRPFQRAFTMVEIAICLGVIGFALVAIIGILPTGMNSQRDNRYDTIINHDGTYWLEAIRTSAQGLDYLTNYVQVITNLAYSWPPPPPPCEGIYTFGPGGPAQCHFSNGSDIIGLLTPWPPGQTNVALVCAISGAAVEKELGKLPVDRDLAFKYQMTVTADSFRWASTNFHSATPESADDPQAVLYDLRVSFRYALRGAATGKGRAAYRTLVSVTPPVGTGTGGSPTNFPFKQ